MSDRTVKVTFSAAVNGYVSGLQQASQATKKFSEDAKSQAQSQGDALTKLGNTAGKAMLAVGALTAAGIGVAVKKFADFDAEMAQVKSLAHATTGEVSELTNAALSVGQQFGYSATEVAQAETELVKAGISITDIMGGALTGALTLAADGQMNVADATQIAAEAMTQFGLKGKDVPHIADLLAAGADKALGSVGDLGSALESGGLVANQFGLSIEETVGTLSAFAQAGLLGETAGTDLRQMLLKLGNPSVQSAKTMKDLGISLYDASGKFVGITNLAGQLQDKMKDLSPATRNAALATIFGSRAIAGANVLYQDGAKGIQGWINSVNDSGFAAKQAAGKLDSLKGDVQKLSAAFDTDLIKSGSAANGLLRGTVQIATDALNAYGKLPVPVQQGALVLAGLTAAATLAGGAFLLGVPKIVAFGAALDTLSGSKIPAVARTADLAKGSMVGLGGALRAVPYIGLGVWLAQFTSDLVMSARAATGLDQTVSGLTKSVEKMSKSDLAKQTNLNVFGVQTQISGLAQLTNFGGLSDAVKNAQKMQDALTGWNPVLKAIGLSGNFASDKMTALDKALTAAVKDGNTQQAAKAYDYLKSQTDGSAGALAKLAALFPKYTAAQKDAQKSTDGATAATEKQRIQTQATSDTTAAASETLAKLSGKADDAKGSIGALATALSNFGKGALDVDAAQSAFRQAIDDATASIEKNGQTLDLNTQQGRDNDATLRGIVTTTLGVVSAQATAGATQDALTGSMQTGRDAFIAAAEAAGQTADQANALADKYGLIPANVNTAITATDQDALNAIANVQAALAALGDKEINIGGSAAGYYGFRQARGGLVDYYADGGFESHVAQIAPAGAMRLWAEPETGGEAYIPLAPSKRARSLAIWEATGNRLGVQGFADGGIRYVSAPSSSGGSSSSLSMAPIYVQNPFTGEYLLAQVSTVAHGVVRSAAGVSAREQKRGYRGQL